MNGACLQVNQRPINQFMSPENPTSSYFDRALTIKQTYIKPIDISGRWPTCAHRYLLSHGKFVFKLICLKSIDIRVRKCLPAAISTAPMVLSQYYQINQYIRPVGQPSLIYSCSLPLAAGAPSLQHQYLLFP